MCCSLQLQGLKRTEVADTLPARPLPQRTWIYVAITAGAFAVGLFFFGRFMVWDIVTQRSTTSELPAKSIAVLPFANLSEEKSNAYFAEGIQDEILTRLAKIADLMKGLRDRQESAVKETKRLHDSARRDKQWSDGLRASLGTAHPPLLIIFLQRIVSRFPGDIAIVYC